MKRQTINAALVWKQFEDLLAPQLSFSLAERAVYSHLLRHSRLVGKRELQFSLTWLARGVGVSKPSVRDAVRRLVVCGVLQLVERSCRAQHVVRLRLPLEVRAVRRAQAAAQLPNQPQPLPLDIEKLDFLRMRRLRQSIHARERGRCFYCLRRTSQRRRVLDHVIPHANLGGNSFRNLVSSCPDCNSRKADRPALEFLRSLYRDRRLSSQELTGRLRALDDLAAGKLKPPLPNQASLASTPPEG